MNVNSAVKSLLFVSAGIIAAIAGAGCQQQSDPVIFSASFPKPNYVGFQGTLTRHYGIGLGGSFDLPKDVGSISLVAETPQAGFGLGINLNTRAFLKDTWVDFREVTALPTGAAFPAWMSGAVVDVQVPGLDNGPIDYHFYLGDHGQYYVGAAGVIKAVDEHFPAVNIGYTFYDKSNNVVVGFQFFGPKIGPDGKAQVPGGIFVGTNLTPLLPKQPQVASSSAALSVQNGQIFALARDAAAGKPVTIDGKSVVADIQTSGRDARRYRSKKDVQGLIDRYFHASRNPW